jgi:hypothetical protein
MVGPRHHQLILMCLPCFLPMHVSGVLSDMEVISVPDNFKLRLCWTGNS